MKVEVNPQTETTEKAAKPAAPSVFMFLDFRDYLKAYYDFKKSVDRGFSHSSFSKKANLKSPNYLKRVMDGDRSLNGDLIPKFCKGLSLNPQESLYFENLVSFNQAKDEDSKQHYFSSLRQITNEISGTALELMGARVDVLKHWHSLAVRELVLFADFQEDPAYIAKKLKNKVTKIEAAFALKALIDSKLLLRDEKTGKLMQAHDMVRYSQDVVNMTVRGFHKQMLERTGEALSEDEYGTWNARALTLAITKDKYQEVYEKISEFIFTMNKIYSFDNEDCAPDMLVQLNCQLIQLTSIEDPPKFKNKTIKK